MKWTSRRSGRAHRHDLGKVRSEPQYVEEAERKSNEIEARGEHCSAPASCDLMFARQASPQDLGSINAPRLNRS
jgi:hypothetical protein